MAKENSEPTSRGESIIQKVLKRKKLLAFLVVVVIVVGFALRSWYLNSQPPEYQKAQVQRQDIIKTLDVSGKLLAEESVNLKFQSVGKLAWIGVKEGDTVRKWQAVASLDKRTLESQLKKDLIVFEKEYRDYDQSVDDTPLINNRFQRILEKAQFDLDSTVIDVEIRNLALELSSLVSPIEGIVTRVDTPYAGVNSSITDTITIVNPQTLYFDAEVDESDISGIQVGQNAEVTLDAYPNDKIKSVVTYVDFTSSIADGGGTVFKVRLSLPENSDLKYRLGMSGDVDITLEELKDVLAIPTEFLIERDGKYYTEQLVGNTVERKEIQVGTITDNETQILSGLNENETIVLTQ